MAAPKKIALITASTRLNRAGPQVTTFIHSLISTSPLYPTISLTTIDVQSFSLPLYDHPSAPALFPPGTPSPLPPSHPALHWSRTITSFDALILITPEYNGGLPAGFKNALDYLYYEVKGKPVLVVSYGVHGGNFANEEARRALGVVMGARVVERKVELGIQREEVGDASKEGRIGEGTLGMWGGSEKRGEVVRGFEELVGMLVEGGEGVVEVIAA